VILFFRYSPLLTFSGTGHDPALFFKLIRVQRKAGIHGTVLIITQSADKDLKTKAPDFGTYREEGFQGFKTLFSFQVYIMAKKKQVSCSENVSPDAEHTERL